MEQKQPSIFSEENEKKLEALQVKVWQFNFKVIGFLIGFLKSAIPFFIFFAILSWIYLTIMAVRGFETALILVLVTLILVTSRKK